MAGQMEEVRLSPKRDRQDSCHFSSPYFKTTSQQRVPGKEQSSGFTEGRKKGRGGAQASEAQVNGE